MSSPHKQAKRLAKAVKRRRLFAEQLRVEANATRAYAQTLDNRAGLVETQFANRLDELATRELDTANEEEQAHRETAGTLRAVVAATPMSPDQEARAARAYTALSERGSVARIQYMCEKFGVGIDHAPGELMKRIESLLDENDMSAPDQRMAMTLGQRINHAETLLFTRPRF